MPLALCLLAAPLRISAQEQTASFSTSKDIEAKVTLESSLEGRLRAVLSKVLDTEDLIVIVNVEMLSETEQIDKEILPGVPLKETPAAWVLPTATRTMIKTVSVTLLLDEGLTDDQVTQAVDTSKNVLDLDETRGDSVSFKKMKLARQSGMIVDEKSPYAKFLEPSWMLSVLWLLMVCVALALIYARFLTPLLTVIRTMSLSRTETTAAGGGPGRPGPEQAPEELPAPTEAAARGNGSEPGDEEEELPFAFIRERHLPMLKFLLARAQPRTAAVIVHYLPPRMAAEVLSILKPEARREVAAHMSKVVQLDEDNVQSIEDSLRSRIDYLMGGEDKLAAILDETPAALQEELLEAVRKKDPKVGASLDRRIVRLDDLALLEPADLKTLSRRVPIRSLAAVLKSSEKLKARILPKLTTGLGAWLAQEIQLSGDLPPDRLIEEQRRVLSAVSQLVREGALVLKKDQAPEEAEGATPAPSAQRPSEGAEVRPPSGLEAADEQPALPEPEIEPPEAPSAQHPSEGAEVRPPSGPGAEEPK